MAETALLSQQSPATATATATATSTQTTTTTTTTSFDSDLSQLPLPRVTIRFCTQCKWMLRAAYFAQELLSTFSTSLGEVALQPATGGVFVVEMYSQTKTSGVNPTDSRQPSIQRSLLWDRKIDGGFPETKELKRRVRDVIEPGRNLGHVDRDYPRQPQQPQQPQQPPKEREQEPNDPIPRNIDSAASPSLAQSVPQTSQVCEDCQ